MTKKEFLELFRTKASSHKWYLMNCKEGLLRTVDDDSCPLTVALGIHWAQRDAFNKTGKATYYAVLNAADCGYSSPKWDKKLRKELLKICRLQP